MLLRIVVLLTAASLTAAPRALAPERAEPNDNRVAAGVVRNGTLALRLEARLAMWHPDGDDAPGALIPAFGELGRAARIPGPMIRVKSGTVADVEVHNALPDTIHLHGLHARSATAADTTPIVLPPRARTRVRFALAEPGTYIYWGTTMRRPLNMRTREDAQLTGAIVVDDPRARRVSDRVLVMGMWTDTVGRARTRRNRVLGVINGRSWPHTERLAHTVGDTVRWRVINASADLHPMHLHGFYFSVDHRGPGPREASFVAPRLVVTESMRPGETIHMRWVPERPGNWLFHCHVPEHFSPRGSLGLRREAHASVVQAGSTAHADHARDGMNGLVMGIDVRPRVGRVREATAPRDERRIRLLVRPRAGGTEAFPYYGYALHEAGPEPAPDSGLAVGPALDLTRGQPVRITVVNRLPEPTAVHWHGIELESYFDGVPGFSGTRARPTPLIAPSDSFVVRFTPPRAGTFIYHTHADEERQQLAGLAGPLIVNEPGVRRDPSTDIPILLTAPTNFDEQARSALVNGRSQHPPIEMRVGKSYRLRFIQMSVARSALRVEAKRDSAFATWRPLAKDGAELPLAMRRVEPARAILGIGETLDVEVTPETLGDLRVEIRLGQPWPAPSILMATVPVLVRP